MIGIYKEFSQPSSFSTLRKLEAALRQKKGQKGIMTGEIEDWLLRRDPTLCTGSCEEGFTKPQR